MEAVKEVLPTVVTFTLQALHFHNYKAAIEVTWTTSHTHMMLTALLLCLNLDLDLSITTQN